MTDKDRNILLLLKTYTARNTEAAASAAGLSLCSHKPILGCVRIVCSGLRITSLLQVVNTRLAAS